MFGALAGTRSAPRLVLSALAAVAGGLAAARPTGVGALDVAWSAGAAAALAYASITAPRLNLLAAAGFASVVADTGESLAAAAVATVLAAVNATGGGRASARLSAATGTLLALSLLLGSGPEDPWLRFATTAGLGAFVLGSGLYGMSRRRRRRVLRWAAALVGVLVLCAAAGTLAALRARTQADNGIDAFRAAQAAATGADLNAAVEAFGEAERSFDDADSVFSGYGRLGRLVPGLSQQLGAAEAAVEAAGDAAEAARVAGSQFELDDLGLQGGVVDLAAVHQAEAPLAQLVTALVDAIARLADVDRGFLAEPVADALDDALDEARDAGASVDRLHRTVEVLPALLGEDGPARYLVLFTSPVEARGRLGFPGSYAVLQADGGRITFEDSGAISTVDPGGPGGQFDESTLAIPARAQPYLGYGVARTWRSVTIPAHAPAAADLAAQMAAQSPVGPVDGVVFADPAALATIIGLVGDVPLEEVGVTLTEANTADFLTRQQYVEFPELGQQADRKDLLVDVAEQVGQRFDTLSLPRAQDVLTRFGPLVEAGHLVLSVPEAVSPDAADLLADVGLDGAFPRAGDGDDVLLVTQINGVGNKIDLFLRRRIAYDVAVDADGQATTTLTVELTNDVPDGDLPPYFVGSALDDPPADGTNITYTLVYSRYPLTQITLDGQALVPLVSSEAGFHVYQVRVDLARGQSRTLEAQAAGPAASRGPYEVLVEPGGLALPDDVTVSVRDARTGDESAAARTLSTRSCFSARGPDERCR